MIADLFLDLWQSHGWLIVSAFGICWCVVLFVGLRVFRDTKGAAR